MQLQALHYLQVFYHKDSTRRKLLKRSFGGTFLKISVSFLIQGHAILEEDLGNPDIANWSFIHPSITNDIEPSLLKEKLIQLFQVLSILEDWYTQTFGIC